MWTQIKLQSWVIFFSLIIAAINHNSSNGIGNLLDITLLSNIYRIAHKINTGPDKRTF